MTDELLLAKFNAGDHRSLFQIIDNHAAGICDYLAERYFNGDEESAALATERAFLALISEEDEIRTLRPWLYHTASVCAVELLNAA